MEKADIPAEWLKKLAEKISHRRREKQIEAMGWDKLMETLRQRLKEQKGRHQGGNKWIGTAGTSPFGAEGYNPEGIRIGQDKNRNFRAVKVWDRREFKDLDGDVDSASAISDRVAAVAQVRPHRRARRTRPRHHDQGDRQHRYLDVHMRPERRNAVKVLVFFDIAARWIRTSNRSRNCSRRRRRSSSTWNISTSTIASMRACGSRTAAALPTGRRPGTCSINIRTITSWCSWRCLDVALRNHGPRGLGRACQ